MLEQMKEEAAQYGKALYKVGKLRVIGIISRVLGLFLLIFTIVLCVLGVFTFGAVAAINAMSACMPVWAAALIVGAAYMVLIIIAIIARRPLFIHPFIALLTKQLAGTQEELAIETLKAENDVNMQNARIEAQVMNATRDFRWTIGILGRVWHWLLNKKK